MARTRIGTPLRAALLDELLAAGLAPLTPEGTTILELDPDGNGGWLTVPDADRATAQAVLDAHNPQAIDRARDQERQQNAADIATLKAYLQLSAPTAAQRLAYEKASIRTLRRVVGELQ